MELGLSSKPEELDAEVNITHCKTALSESGLESDYALNPYRGCTHGCIYCYAPFVIKEEREWGSFVDVKRNIPKILSDELERKEKGIVRIGSVCDPYQPVEESYELTRLCLQQLSKKDFPVIIQTKSGLVERDIDLLKEMDASVGFTITSLDDDFRGRFEPNAPPVSERLSVLKKLNEEDIDTWAFIGPLFPGKNDDIQQLKRLGETLHSLGVEEVYLDKLNMREGIWKKLKDVLDEENLELYRNIYFEKEDYFEDRKKIYKEIGKPVF